MCYSKEGQASYHSCEHVPEDHGPPETPHMFLKLVEDPRWLSLRRTIRDLAIIFRLPFLPESDTSENLQA
ncbi:hypothetical protein M422DRAFT_274518 [Sphaerobolus stellatus SS14]|uniref:Uncharacterized protein n=1 Tax=Sphaerobolus stellatus (strain SS14) TaxID=990650 RepID=A0A0C9UHE6_SPHS4|nr:hypothetical protein M422DRAFT_274518 [Sphaerobolus stellatus SS14]